ncbi:uncharacterized protein LOC132282074 [Cornus florida]|uniref:uncharacterized protein LOC132282074 n=1 Tax=Cornus florida TaxID=4283 RepID=UPI0028A05D11|nr:uncharacterized protein LOC132282074 [Cornus florida]
MREMRKKFDGLYQGSMSVMEYENKLTFLSRYAPNLVYSEVVRRALLVESEDKDSQWIRESKKHFRGEASSSGSQSKKFRRGGGSSYSQGSQQQARPAPTVPLSLGSTREVVCHHCHQSGHIKPCCPQLQTPTTQSFTASTGLLNTCFSCGQTGHFKKECPQRGSGSRGGTGSQYRQSQLSVVQSGSRVPQTPQPAASVQGPRPARGSTPSTSHSFISSSFAHSLGLEITSLDGVLCVDTAVGGPVTLNRICRGCAIELAGRTLWFDFIPLEMTGFDVILGMDWLFFFQATIDCFRGRGRHRFYLASLLVEEEWSLGDSFPAVVGEFVDVFPEELTELPPIRDVVFAIDVIPGTAPISMASYRMAPAELNELKSQLDDLKAKGFIRPNASPWGAPEEHESHLRTMLQTLRDNWLYTKYEKCEFWLPEVKFLGHVVSGGGVSVNPSKIEAVMDWERPKSGIKFVWNEACELAFQELKTRLTTAPILVILERGLGYVIYCDVSRNGLGCVLMLTERVVAYGSRQLKTHKQNYSTHDLELAVVISH